MAKKTAAEHKQDQADEIQKSVENEVNDVTKAAEKAREDAPDSAETEEEYRERIANVPGIFGDIDTTAGAGAAGVDVISSQNELATVAVAEVVADPDNDASADEARRQPDIAGGQPSAEEVEEGAPDQDNDSSSDDKKSSAKTSSSSRSTKK